MSLLGCASKGCGWAAGRAGCRAPSVFVCVQAACFEALRLSTLLLMALCSTSPVKALVSLVPREEAEELQQQLAALQHEKLTASAEQQQLMERLAAAQDGLTHQQQQQHDGLLQDSSEAKSLHAQLAAAQASASHTEQQHRVLLELLAHEAQAVTGAAAAAVQESSITPQLREAVEVTLDQLVRASCVCVGMHVGCTQVDAQQMGLLSARVCEKS